MDLLDRYLAAIRRNLPGSEADDITAELRDTLVSQREDREAELGRPLTAGEVEAMLKAFGHPLVVAARYGKTQHLIGPEYYPFYVYTVKLVLTVLGAVLLTLAVAGVVFSAGDSAQIISRALAAFWNGGLFALGAITALFILMERYAPPSILLRRWRPSSLPAIEPKKDSRWDHVSSLTIGAVFLLWWTGMIDYPDLTRGRLQLTLAPIWGEVFWPVIAVTALGMLAHMVILLRPNWLTVRAVLNLAVLVASLVVLAWIYRAGHWVDVAGSADPTGAGREKTLNLIVRIGLVAAGVIWTWECLQEGWRVWKARRTR